MIYFNVKINRIITTKFLSTPFAEIPVNTTFISWKVWIWSWIIYVGTDSVKSFLSTHFEKLDLKTTYLSENSECAG